MTRTFNHNLNILCPCTLCQLTKTNEFLNLTYITCICKTSRTAGITKRNCNIIFTADIQDFIIIFIKRILFTGHTHPCKNQRTATGHNIHFTFVLTNLFNCLTCNAAMKGYKIHTILSMQAHDINKILCSKCCQISLIVNHTVINRNSTNHGWTF